MAILKKLIYEMDLIMVLYIRFKENTFRKEFQLNLQYIQKNMVIFR